MASDGEILDYKDLLNKFNLTDEFYPLVYVCSPYRGNIEENTRKAREIQHLIEFSPTKKVFHFFPL